MKKPFILTVFITFLSTASLYAQGIEKIETNQTIHLKGTHSISLHAGFQNFESNLAYTSGAITSTTNFIGHLSYQYWHRNNAALSFSVGILKFENYVRFSRSFKKSTIPLVIGYNFYPNSLHWDKGRGYFGMNMGAYIETNSSVNFEYSNLEAETKNEIKPGADLHFGIDFFPSESIRIGPQIAFHATEYIQGAALSVTLGVLL